MNRDNSRFSLPSVAPLNPQVMNIFEHFFFCYFKLFDCKPIASQMAKVGECAVEIFESEA